MNIFQEHYKIFLEYLLPIYDTLHITQTRKNRTKLLKSNKNTNRRWS